MEQAADKINILPVEPEQLTLPQSERHPDREQRMQPVLRGDREERCGVFG